MRPGLDPPTLLWMNTILTANDLATCVGYRVDSPEGRVGSVAAVLPSGEIPGGALLVHTGLLHCTLSALPFELVERVDADRRRVLVRGTSLGGREGTRRSAGDPVAARS